jgi:thiamine pyrophosphokinase
LADPDRILYRARGPVTLIGGGPVAADELAAALALAPEAVAADGGGDRRLPAGTVLRAVIGDLDSLKDPGALRAAGVPVHRVAEQETTDLEKCLYSVAAPLFIGLGFLGGRIDHHLAAMNALARHPRPPVVLVGGGELCFLCPERLALELPEGTRVSLFPMGPVRGLASEGLRWTIAGLDFAPDGRVGTSNRALGGPVRLGFDAPRMLAILPAAELAGVVAALRPVAGI